MRLSVSFLFCVWSALLCVLCSPAMSVGSTVGGPVGHLHRPAPSAVHAKKHEFPLAWQEKIAQLEQWSASATDDTPSQIRLALIPGGMTVSWVTKAQLATPPTVQYGLTPTSLVFSQTGQSHTYGTVWFHDVLLQNLDYNTLYFYQAQGTPDGPVLNFTTALKPGDMTPFNTLIVGDMGLDNSANTIAQLQAAVTSTNMVYHVGDLSYADDYYLRWNNTYEGSWNTWQTIMEPITSALPYMCLPGNHEASCTEATPFLCPANQKNFTAFRHRFRMPSDESGAVGAQNMWSSFDYGMAHFVSISTETDFPNAPENPGTWMSSGPFGDQLTWLKADLEKAVANRVNVPWIIVGGHRPWYTSTHHHCTQCMAAFEELFNQYGVDIYVAGHVHWTERMFPTAPGGTVTQQNYVNPTAPVYIIAGGSGNVEGHDSLDVLQPYTAFYNGQDFGYGRFSFQNATTMTWEFYRATDNAILDTMTLIKERN